MAIDTASPTNDDNEQPERRIESSDLTDKKVPTSNGESITPAANDPEPDFSQFRLRQDYTETVGTKKLLTTVLVHKPYKHDFVRTHHNPSYQLNTKVLELEHEKETYLIHPELWGALEGETTIVDKTLLTAISNRGEVFLWPIGLPRENQTRNSWNESARDIASCAVDKWIRLRSNTSAKLYEAIDGGGIKKEPEWPKLSFNQLLQMAFKDKIIKTLDHPVLRRLLGEID